MSLVLAIKDEILEVFSRTLEVVFLEAHQEKEATPFLGTKECHPVEDLWTLVANIPNPASLQRKPRNSRNVVQASSVT
jgi:hypothetical protein